MASIAWIYDYILNIMKELRKPDWSKACSWISHRLKGENGTLRSVFLLSAVNVILSLLIDFIALYWFWILYLLDWWRLVFCLFLALIFLYYVFLPLPKALRRQQKNFKTKDSLEDSPKKFSQMLKGVAAFYDRN